MKQQDLLEARIEAGKRIRAFVLRHVHEHPKNLPLVAATELGVSATIVYEEVRGLIKEGLLQGHGRTSGRWYEITARGAALRNDPSLLRQGLPSREDADRDLLAREPRTLQEAERKAWLLRIQNRQGRKK